MAGGCGGNDAPASPSDIYQGFWSGTINDSDRRCRHLEHQSYRWVAAQWHLVGDSPRRQPCWLHHVRAGDDGSALTCAGVWHLRIDWLERDREWQDHDGHLPGARVRSVHGLGQSGSTVGASAPPPDQRRVDSLSPGPTRPLLTIWRVQCAGGDETWPRRRERRGPPPSAFISQISYGSAIATQSNVLVSLPVSLCPA